MKNIENFKFCDEFLLKWMKGFCKGKLRWNIIMIVQLLNKYTYNLSSRLKSSWTSVSLWLMRSLCVVAGLLVTSKRSNHGRFFFIVNKVWFKPAYNDNYWFIITVHWALSNISSLFKRLLCYICIRNLHQKMQFSYSEWKIHTKNLCPQKILGLKIGNQWGKFFLK